MVQMDVKESLRNANVIFSNTIDEVEFQQYKEKLAQKKRKEKKLKRITTKALRAHTHTHKHIIFIEKRANKIICVYMRRTFIHFYTNKMNKTNE